MKRAVYLGSRWLLRAASMSVIAASWLLLNQASVSALNPIPIPDPQPGGSGLEATKTQPPPTQGATITTPGNGASFSSSPISVSGICPSGLLVQIYNNNVMVGAVMCENGSFSLEVSLFAGTNELKAIVFDDLEQSGPESNITTVNYSDTRFTAFGELVTLTSDYGRRSSPAGSQLAWPLLLSGGTGPYAFSIDWGDGSQAQLLSQSFAGPLNIAYAYKRAGIYQVNIKAVDANGVSAFLQVIAVSSGQMDSSDKKESVDSTASMLTVIWIPAAIAVAMLWPAYWLGRRSQIVSLRNKMLKERDAYQNKK